MANHLAPSVGMSESASSALLVLRSGACAVGGVEMSAKEEDVLIMVGIFFADFSLK